MTTKMIDKNPDLFGWLYRAFQWATSHPIFSWGVLTTFTAAMWSAWREGKGKAESFFSAIVATVFALSLLGVMHLAGLHENYIPIIGMIVGFYGADRIRSSIIEGLNALKQKHFGDKKNED